MYNICTNIQEREPALIESDSFFSLDGPKELLKKFNHDLLERVKELKCLYGVSSLISMSDMTMEEVFRGVIELIPPSWQFPDITSAKITFEEKEYKADNFNETKWKQSADIIVSGKRSGAMDVYYLEEKSQIYEGPFLKEKRALINTIANELGLFIERKRAEESLKKRTYELRERVKELNCLYGISKLVDKANISLEEIIQGIADLIPPAWQYSEITCSRIILHDREFRTDNFEETIWKQSCEIFVHSKRVGVLEVCYMEKREKIDKGSFLKEEKNLLNVIAERIGRIIERIDTKKALAESEYRYRILTDHVADGVAVIQDGRFVFINHVVASMLGYDDVSQLRGKMAVDFVSLDFRQHFQQPFKAIDTGKTSEKTFQWKCIKADGSEIWVEGHFNEIMREGNLCFLCTVRDITEAKLREIAMQQEAERLQIENRNLRTSMSERYKFGSIIGWTAGMQKVYNLISKTAASDTNVVIYGESGTGKELVAQTIYDRSSLYKKGFVPVNCGAIPETIFESEFFGYRKGAFTGAQEDKHGFFDLANKGMLFLDEVGELTLNMQVKLLRAIENGEFTPVGDNRARRVDTRIVAATNRNLINMVDKGLMREDFFYRIQIISIKIPPLRERKEDIPLLVEHFLHSNGNGKKGQHISGRIMDELCNHDWPGNVRELQNVMHRYLILGNLDFFERYAGRPVENDHLPSRNQQQETNDYNAATQSLEKDLITRALETTRWNKSKTATMLGIPRRTLYRKIEKFGIR